MAEVGTPSPTAFCTVQTPVPFDPARHDEAIVCTLPGRSSKWIQHDFPHRVARFTGVPVTHVVVDLKAEEAATPA